MQRIIIVMAMTLFAEGIAAAPPAEPVRDARLDQLLGRWEGQGTFTVGGKSNPWRLSYDCRASVGPAVVCNVVGTGGAMRYEEVHLFGVNKASGEHHLFSVNSWGEAYDHVARWVDDKRVSFEHAGTNPEGKPLKETYVFEMRGPKEISFTGTLTVDGRVMGEGVYSLRRN